MPRTPTRPLMLLGACLWATAVLTGQGDPAPPASAEGTVGERFISQSRTWSMELPPGWRQLSPGEAADLLKKAPEYMDEDMHLVRPVLNELYTIGRVDRWLEHGYDGVSLVVVEQGDEWVHDENLPGGIARHWQDLPGDHTIEGIREVLVGKDRHPALEALRNSTTGERQWRSLDLYVPSGGNEIILSFRSPRAEFDAWEPRFREWITTASFARPPRGHPSLFDRLFWPLMIGGTVAIALILGYRTSRRPPGPMAPPPVPQSGHPPQG